MDCKECKKVTCDSCGKQMSLIDCVPVSKQSVKKPDSDRIEFIIYGEPQALKRHRTVLKAQGNIHIDPSKSDKQDFLVQAMSKKPRKPFEDPLKMTLVFAFQRPKAHYGTGKNSGILKASAPKYHTSTPDTDNLVKFVCDALNTVFFRDDSLVCSLDALKIYSDRAPYVQVVIEKLPFYLTQD